MFPGRYENYPSCVLNKRQDDGLRSKVVIVMPIKHRHKRTDLVNLLGSQWRRNVFRVRYELYSSWRMASSGMLRRVTRLRTDVSGELSDFFIRLTRIGELVTTLAVTSNRRTLRRNTKALVLTRVT
jgi:hypothetical protein